jgi:hypothetical protein
LQDLSFVSLHLRAGQKGEGQGNFAGPSSKKCQTVRLWDQIENNQLHHFLDKGWKDVTR